MDLGWPGDKTQSRACWTIGDYLLDSRCDVAADAATPATQVYKEAAQPSSGEIGDQAPGAAAIVTAGDTGTAPT